jgi:predicted restriction endonuclease
MSKISKTQQISHFFNTSIKVILSDLYTNQQMSSQEISDYIFAKTNIKITTRSIQRIIKLSGLTRNLSDAFNISIKKGRKTYDKLRRKVKSSSMRKGIQPKLRYQVLKRDKFKCVLCGATAIDDHLEIDHIKPVVYGGNNDVDNLRTLCAECNKGKMLFEERI